MTQAKPTSGQERRRHPRVQADLPVFLELEDGTHQARLRDVSQAGVCFFLDRPIPEMTALALSLELPLTGGAREVRGNGAVVRCEKISAVLDHYEIAVFLPEIDTEGRAAIASYVGST